MPTSPRKITPFFDKTASLDIDTKRRLYSFLAFSGVGFIILAIFSYRDFWLNDNNVSIITLITSLTVFTNVLFYYVTKRLDFCCGVMGVIAVCFCLMLTYHGGVNNTALYWTFPFPIIILVLLGYYYGVIINIILFLLLVLMLNNQELLIAKYSHVESLRYIGSFFVVNVMSFINEFYREHSHSTMAEININKEQQANTDALTLLPNRRFVDSVFLPASRTNHNNTFPMVLIMADVDHFKALNDNYGHPVGDKVLEQLARTMEKSIRAEDIVARIGGEEFLLLFSNTQYEVGLKIAEKIRKNIENMSIKHSDDVLSITMSFGVALSKDHADIETTMKLADEKLYKAKRSGRNCVC